MRSRLFAVLLLAGSTAFGADPVVIIKGVKTVPVNTVFTIDARDSVSDKPLVWKAVDPPDVSFETFDKGKKESGFAIATSPGKAGVCEIAIAAIGVVDGETKFDFQVWKVLVTDPGPSPKPDPGPNPQPTPDPGPVAVLQDGPAWVTAVFPYSTNPVVAELYQGMKIRDASREAKVFYHAFYSDNPEIDKKGLRRFIADKKLPVLVVQDKTGTIVATVPMEDEDSVVKFLSGLRGAK